MSEFTQKSKSRVSRLTDYFVGLINGKNGSELLKEFQILETRFSPLDIVAVFDNIFNIGADIEEIKVASNKLFNILYKSLSEREKQDLSEIPVFKHLIEDNAGVKGCLSRASKSIKLINKKYDREVINRLIRDFNEIEKFTIHYTVVENIVFPEIEKNWEHFQCLKLMWSFHDDIRQNIKRAVKTLKSEPFDLKLFNKISSKIYFNINTIIFREENILYPVMIDTMDKDIFIKMLNQLGEFNLMYSEVISGEKRLRQVASDSNLIKFATGEMSPEQIESVFNHLPVDITFVDENDKVKYYSTPPHRIFPRTTGVIGRTVQNCHPHESVEIVNKIIRSFKKGEKDIASFRIKKGKQYLLIRYFAIRDNDNNYKGILEVSQEISEIQNLKGEHRLLDW